MPKRTYTPILGAVVLRCCSCRNGDKNLKATIADVTNFQKPAEIRRHAPAQTPMRVGSRGDYGLRALVFLASAVHKGEPVPIGVIAKRQKIPEDYLRQLLGQLRTAGLVRSVRGPHGGYLLARPPGTISMQEVLTILEGPYEAMRCSHLDDGTPPCTLLAGCKIRQQWRQAAEDMEDTLRQTSIADLLGQEMKV